MKETRKEKEFELILVDPNKELCEAWEERFGDYPNVKIRNDYFEKLVMIAEDRLTLNQSFVERGSVTVKIYYTKVN